MKALILAAGYGTRLYPLTEKQAKPLLPVAGKPMVEHIIRKIESVAEIDEIYLVINAKFSGDFEKWACNFKTDRKITLFDDGSTDDGNKLGAIGDMRFVIEKAGVSDDMLVVAGDNLFDFELGTFVEFFHRERVGKPTPAIGLYRVEPIELVRKYSVVELDEEKKILSFEEKPEHPSTNLIAICLYLFPKNELRLILKYLEDGNNPDAPGYYIKWLVQKTKVYGFTLSGKWLDIGDFKSYEEANRVFS